MTKIHIIGANGYIGALLINYLYAMGHYIEKSPYRLPNIPVKCIDADIVIHLAGAGGGTEHKPRSGYNNPEYMQNVHIEGMKAMLAGLINQNTKIIFISSTAVYGKFLDSPLVNEEAKLEPVSLYGQHKVESEKILMNSNFEWLILRPVTIFGPSYGNRFGNSFLNIVLANALKYKTITLIGGNQKIDTLYILDLIQIILRSCEGDWYPFEVFNIAGEIISVEKIIGFLKKSLVDIGIPCSIRKKDFIEKPSIIADTSKLKQSFPGWNNTSLDLSIHSLITSFLCQNKMGL